MRASSHCTGKKGPHQRDEQKSTKQMQNQHSEGNAEENNSAASLLFCLTASI